MNTSSVSKTKSVCSLLSEIQRSAVDCFSLLLSNGWTESIWNTFSYSINWNGQERESKTNKPLSVVKTRSWAVENILSELGHKYLNNNYKTPDENKHEVLVNSVEHIPFIVNLSGVDHIDNLHEDEDCENNSEMSWRSIFSFISSIEIFIIPLIRSTRVD